MKRNKEMKKVVKAVLILAVTILLSSCALYTDEKSVENYGEFFEKAGAISEYLIFPEEIPESATEVTYRCLWNDISLIDPTIQIYLEYQLGEEEYAAEVQRISGIQLDEGIYPVWLDEESFEYPAYVATDGYSHEYEYVLMDEENHRLISIDLWNEFHVNVKFDKDCLPDYFGKDEILNGLKADFKSFYQEYFL